MLQRNLEAKVESEKFCNHYDNTLAQIFHLSHVTGPRAITRTLIGGCIFIYSGSAQLVSFEIKLISKEISQAEPEYMNIHPPISVLATALTGPLLKIRCVRKVIDMKSLYTNTMLFTRKPGVLHATPDCLKIRHAREIYKIHLQ